MTRLIHLLSLGLIAASLPHIAAAQTATDSAAQLFTVDPGLYESTTTVIMGGQTVVEESAEDCVREGENSKTLEELVEDIRREGNCTLSNISTTNTTGQADFICKPDGLGLEATGSFKAEYGPEFLTLTADGNMGFLGNFKMGTDARRIGECPVDAAAP